MAKIKDLGGNCKTDKGIDCFPPFPVLNEYEEFKGILKNALSISETTWEEQNRILDLLIENNRVGYDTVTDYWGEAAGLDFNKYRNPVWLEFIYPQGTPIKRRASYEPNPDGSYLIRGIPSDISFGKIIKAATDVIELCDNVIMQNLAANKTPEIVVVPDADTRLSVLQAIQQKQQGAPAIVVSDKILDALKGVPLNTPFIVNEVYTFRQQVRDNLINKLGTMSANINKRERVQVGEVNATVGQCEDYIYMLIDNFNRQMESFGLKPRISLNNSLEELYTVGGVSDMESTVDTPEPTINKE